MKYLLCGVAASVCLLFATGARADTVDTLTLTPTLGSAGTGSLDINGSLLPTGTTTYSTTNRNDTLEALSFTIDGDTFDLNGDEGATVKFNSSGSLTGIDYTSTEAEGGLFATITFQDDGSLDYAVSTGAFGFDPNVIDKGTISLSPAAAVTPEPPSLALLGTGLIGSVVMLRRRRLV